MCLFVLVWVVVICVVGCDFFVLCLVEIRFVEI